MNNSKFQNWANEVNKNWSAGYVATATDESLSVAFDEEEVAAVNYRLDVEGSDDEAVSQLEFMISR